MDIVQTEHQQPPARRHADGARASRSAQRERRCLVTRDSRPADTLIRFGVSPDGAVVPDIEERLPGRGLWLTATRDIVDTACRKHVFEKAVRGPVSVDEHLADTIEQLLVRRCLSLLGIARRAGEAVTGFEKVRDLAGRGKAGLLLTASDAAADGRRKIESASRKTTQKSPAVGVFTSGELGGVFGRDAAVHVAVTKGEIGALLLIECNRLAGFRPVMAE